jgi:hypothetical protein
VRQKIRSQIRWLSALVASIALIEMLTGGLALHYVEKSLVAAAGNSLTLAAAIEVVAHWIGAPASISGSTGDHPLLSTSGGTAC